jgi:hypothetical protein
VGQEDRRRPDFRNGSLLREGGYDPADEAGLAIAGYQGLQRHIEKAVAGKTGADAVRAMAHAMRSFALGSPGLAVASFRDPDVDNPEYQKAAGQLAQTVLRIFAEAGVTDEAAKHAIRILKSLVRGFVLGEMSARWRGLSIIRRAMSSPSRCSFAV